MSNELTKREEINGQLSSEQVALLKDMFFKGSSDGEFKVFIHACQRSRLDPFMRQIYPVKRWDATLKREVMTVQTGIDGYRLIAERTHKYMAGEEPSYKYGPNGEIISATAYVKKLGPDKQWHIVSATAFYDEYCQKTKEGRPNAMWAKMPHNQLAKCAESLALRKAFPADMSGIYTSDEMAQGTVADESTPDIDIVIKEEPYVDDKITEVEIPPCITRAQKLAVLEVLAQCELSYQEKILSWCTKKYGSLDTLPENMYDRLIEGAQIARDDYRRSLETANTAESGQVEGESDS